MLERLKEIFETSFKDIFNNNTFKLFDFSRNNTYVIEPKDGPDGKLLSIDLTKANEEEKKKLKEIIDENIQVNEDTFLTERYSKKTENIKQNLPKQKDIELLFFYKDKISSEMYDALEMSLVVRNLFANGGDITELKRDISYKFPEFGKNICNLATSNYFDEYFKRLYDTMAEEKDFDISKYTKEVERIVRGLPYMVFIHPYKSLQEFKGEVKFKVEKLRKYGTAKLRLHSLGGGNVEKALKIIEDYENNEEGIVLEKEINENKTLAIITFRF